MILLHPFPQLLEVFFLIFDVYRLVQPHIEIVQHLRRGLRRRRDLVDGSLGASHHHDHLRELDRGQECVVFRHFRTTLDVQQLLTLWLHVRLGFDAPLQRSDVRILLDGRRSAPLGEETLTKINNAEAVERRTFGRDTVNCLPCHFTATVTSSGIAMSAPRCVSRGGKVRMGDLGLRGNSSNLFSSFAFLLVRYVALDYFLGSAAAPWRRTGRPGGRIRRGRRVLARVRARPRSSPGPPPDLCRLSHCSRSRSSRPRMQAHRLRAGSLPKGMFATAGCVVREEGVRSLWAGVSASCVRTAAGAGLYFLLLERVTRELNERFPMGKDASSTAVGARTFAVGAASRSLAATLLCPVTVVKTRMEYATMSGAKYAGVTNALWTIGRNEGAGVSSAAWAPRCFATRPSQV